MAAGVVASSAQVYSANVVGYVSLSLTNGYNMINNPLDLDGTGTNNTVQAVFGSQLPSGSSVYAFANGAYANPSAGYTTKGGWAGGTNAADVALCTGGGVFVKVPSAVTVTMVGNVMQGNLSTHFNNGYNIISSQVPMTGLMQTGLGYPPTSVTQYIFGTRGPKAYNNPASGYTTKGGWGGGGQPNLAIGQAVFLKSAAGAGGNWTTNFTVQ